MSSFYIAFGLFISSLSSISYYNYDVLDKIKNDVHKNPYYGALVNIDNSYKFKRPNSNEILNKKCEDKNICVKGLDSNDDGKSVYGLKTSELDSILYNKEFYYNTITGYSLVNNLN